MIHKHEHLEYGFVWALFPLLAVGFFGVELYEADRLLTAFLIALPLSVIAFAVASRSFARIGKREGK